MAMCNCELGATKILLVKIPYFWYTKNKISIASAISNYADGSQLE